MDPTKTPYKILHRLQDGQFHSGETLAKQFNITRSAIWKAIKQLTQLGLPIESISGRGYRILGGINLLDTGVITKTINRVLNHPINLHVLNQVDSTNDYLLALPTSSQRQVVLAEQQHCGRGRHGRHWVSPFGHNIYASVEHHFPHDPSTLGGLSLAMGVAVLRTLKQLGFDNPSLQLKWPNDLLYQHKKLSGILIDIQAEAHGSTRAIIGIGINTHLTEVQGESIDQPWTSLAAMQQQPIDRNQLASQLIIEIITALEQFQSSGFTAFKAAWLERAAYLQQMVTLQQGNQQISGLAQGVTDTGELIIRNNNQHGHTITSGELIMQSGK